MDVDLIVVRLGLSFIRRKADFYSHERPIKLFTADYLTRIQSITSVNCLRSEAKPDKIRRVAHIVASQVSSAGCLAIRLVVW